MPTFTAVGVTPCPSWVAPRRRQPPRLDVVVSAKRGTAIAAIALRMVVLSADHGRTAPLVPLFVPPPIRHCSPTIIRTRPRFIDRANGVLHPFHDGKWHAASGSRCRVGEGMGGDHVDGSRSDLRAQRYPVRARPSKSHPPRTRRPARVAPRLAMKVTMSPTASIARSPPFTSRSTTGWIRLCPAPMPAGHLAVLNSCSRWSVVGRYPARSMHSARAAGLHRAGVGDGVLLLRLGRRVLWFGLSTYQSR